MSDESRVELLLEETLESGRPAEEVCAQFPRLMWQVLERLRQYHSVEAQIDALFPQSSEGIAARRRRLILSDDSLPDILGYHVEAVLGRGGVGVVYRAKHRKLNRYVALKMLLSGAYADPHELARFMWPSRWRACGTNTSFKCTTSLSSTGSLTSRWRSWRAGAWHGSSRARLCRPIKLPRSWPRARARILGPPVTARPLLTRR